MGLETAAHDDDSWVPAVSFADGGPLLAGTLSFPLPSFLTADEALCLVESADRLIAWGTAMKMQALARVEEAIGEESGPRREGQPVHFGGNEAHALAVTEVATACAVSEGSAARSLNDAAEMTTSRWEVLEAVEEGKISPAHARIILEQACTLPPEHAQKFSRMALQRARTRDGRRRTAVELRACLRRLRERLHPESLAARKAVAQRERGVWFRPEPDGMCTLTALLPAEAGLAIFNGLDSDARLASARAAEPREQPGSGTAAEGGQEPDSRTLPEYRADALVHRMLGGADGDFGEFRPEVLVKVPVGHVLGAAAGLAAAAGTAVGTFASKAAGHEAAELEGYGPIDEATALRMAALAPNWRRLFTDCVTGEALGVGRTAYRPPKALLQYLHSRDGTCRFPGCTRPASSCEPDHTVEWQDGGSTDADNLAMLCRRHHALKSIGAWKYTLDVAGHLEWRSPLGRRYATAPAAVESAPDPPKPPRPPEPPF